MRKKVYDVVNTHEIVNILEAIYDSIINYVETKNQEMKKKGLYYIEQYPRYTDHNIEKIKKIKDIFYDIDCFKWDEIGSAIKAIERILNDRKKSIGCGCFYYECDHILMDNTINFPAIIKSGNLYFTRKSSESIPRMIPCLHFFKTFKGQGQRINLTADEALKIYEEGGHKFYENNNEFYRIEELYEAMYHITENRKGRVYSEMAKYAMDSVNHLIEDGAPSPLTLHDIRDNIKRLSLGEEINKLRTIEKIERYARTIGYDLGHIKLRFNG